ncbi:ankyrin repeat-containing domain, PGG domain protein [Tanacetum coccineum]
MMTKEDLEFVNKTYNTALFLAAVVGNLETVKIMVKKNRALLIIPGAGKTMMPLYAAVLFRNNEVVKYLYQESKDLSDDGALSLLYWDMYKAQQELNPPLEISKERCLDPSQEKMRNRFPISTLMQQNPDRYRLMHIKVKLYDDTPSPRDFPLEILNLKGREHTFQFHYNPSCEKGKVDFHFDDILDKPLQITSGPKAETQVPGGNELIASGSVTPQISSKEIRHTETSQLPDTPSQLTAGSKSPSNKTYDEPEKGGIAAKRTSKRPLFQDNPDDQKKKKTD